MRIRPESRFMVAPFQSFAQAVKPVLDVACTRQLERLLGDLGFSLPGGAVSSLGQGKKIRGILLCLVSGVLGGKRKEALPRAVAVELIQAASLVHDDLVDQHRVRRNMPAIWTQEGARRAVLLGDLLFSAAIRMMSELGREDGLIVSRAIAEISRGAFREPLDPSSALARLKRKGNGSGYEKIIALKTGVLFAAACQLGAVAAGIDADGLGVWGRYGQKIGEAYQIADDQQEMDRVLRQGFLRAEEMTELAPAVLFFVKSSRRCLCRALSHPETVLEGDLLAHFEASATLMRVARENRLCEAIEALDGHLPKGPLAPVVRQAPWELIRMFDGIGTP